MAMNTDAAALDPVAWNQTSYIGTLPGSLDEGMLSTLMNGTIQPSEAIYGIDQTKQEDKAVGVPTGVVDEVVPYFMA
ncbi:MAG: hypothetical protein L6R38_001247 [Xanthoria sp. 2 TBL-2021]|nr:MAG: hypothetical protein L6R38_001247 [Xanthoria sp. 2 TBL-2021]